MIRKTFDHIVKNKSGSTMVETALCLPMLLYMIFFIMEIIRISILQIALDAVSIQATFEFSGSKNTKNFKAIINDTIPPFLRNGEIRTYIKIYPSVNAAVTGKDGEITWTPDYGQSVSWPSYDGQITKSIGVNDNLIPGNAFELTVVCKYRFTSGFTAMLFGQGNTDTGTNTGKEKNNNLFIWSRACAVCN